MKQEINRRAMMAGATGATIVASTSAAAPLSPEQVARLNPSAPTTSPQDGPGARFLQSGPRAVVRSVQDKLAETVTVGDFGAIGADDTTDTAGLQAALDSFSPVGGVVHLPRGVYSTDRGLSITQPISISGDGGVYTAINPGRSAGGQDTLTITPSTGTSSELQRLQGFALHDPRTGTRRGRHGLMLSTRRRNEFLPKLTIRDLNIGQGDGYAIYHAHDPDNGVQGGMFGSTIENCVLKGGVRLDGSGDSNSISNCLISGTNIGVSANLIRNASLLNISGNNITNEGGALRLTSGSRIRFTGNNVENMKAGAAAQNEGAVVNIHGTAEPITGGVISENLLSVFGDADATILLRLRNCRGTAVRDNVFLTGKPGVAAIDIGEDCQDVRIGPNTYADGIAVTVRDRGVGTMGVVKAATLQNNWAPRSPDTASLQYLKGCDGVVHVWGEIVGGRSDNGTSVSILPTGFRPGTDLTTSLQGSGRIGALAGLLKITPAGALSIHNVAGADILFFNLSFPAARLGNASSPE